MFTALEVQDIIQTTIVMISLFLMGSLILGAIILKIIDRFLDKYFPVPEPRRRRRRIRR